MWAGTEECDDQNSNNDDACLNSCATAFCGDGFVWAGIEMCDDNNTTAGDGCDATCTREDTWCCTGEPSACVEGPFMIGADNLGLSIPDGQAPTAACASYMFAQKGCGPVSDVDVVMGVTHSRLGHLAAQASHPADNNTELMMFFPGYPNTIGGDSSNLAATDPVTFNDGAATSAESMGSTIGGNGTACKNDNICEYDPDSGQLASYNGMSPEGSWKLCVADAVLSDAGTLEEVRFIITTQ